MSNRIYFLGLETEEQEKCEWEKDGSLDNYGLYDNENDYERITL